MQEIRQGRDMEKREARRRARSRQQALCQAEQERADRAIEKAILESDAFREANRIFTYLSIPGEPDTWGIVRTALAMGKTVCVPRCLPCGIMQAVQIRSLEGLIPTTWGIQEPADTEKAETQMHWDLILVPCVSAGRDGRRLGHGAGYYDRFLVQCTGTTFCLCYAALMENALPVDETDVLMDFIVSERGIEKVEA